MEGYNQEPNKEFTFTLTATPPAGADPGISQIKDRQIYITKKSEATAMSLSFANNEATFTLKKGESVDISCLPIGWSYKVSEVNPGKNYKTTHKINNGTACDRTNTCKQWPDGFDVFCSCDQHGWYGIL